MTVCDSLPSFIPLTAGIYQGVATPVPCLHLLSKRSSSKTANTDHTMFPGIEPTVSDKFLQDLKMDVDGPAAAVEQLKDGSGEIDESLYSRQLYAS